MQSCQQVPTVDNLKAETALTLEILEISESLAEEPPLLPDMYLPTVYT